MPSGSIALAPYLQGVAAALAAADATPERVLVAAQARDVRRSGSSEQFRAPDPRIRYADVSFASVRDGDFRPESVEFVCDETSAPVVLAEIASAFGAWSRTTAGSSIRDMHPVTFDVPYPPPRSSATRRAETVVRVSLTADPAASGVRVREILLTRLTVDP